MTDKYPAEIEVDNERGVVYVHLLSPSDVEKIGIVTAIRILDLNRKRVVFPLDIINGSTTTDNVVRAHQLLREERFANLS